MPAAYFRAGAGVIVVRRDGRVLAFERRGGLGWQLPQGGLDAGETFRRAALREFEEETGIRARDVAVAGAYPEPIAYELPVRYRTARTGLGQVHHWFYLRPRRELTPVLPVGGELRRAAWLTFDQLIRRAPAFRRPVYRKLRDYWADGG